MTRAGPRTSSENNGTRAGVTRAGRRYSSGSGAAGSRDSNGSTLGAWHAIWLTIQTRHGTQRHTRADMAPNARMLIRDVQQSRLCKKAPAGASGSLAGGHGHHHVRNAARSSSSGTTLTSRTSPRPRWCATGPAAGHWHPNKRLKRKKTSVFAREQVKSCRSRPRLRWERPNQQKYHLSLTAPLALAPRRDICRTVRWAPW